MKTLQIAVAANVALCIVAMIGFGTLAWLPIYHLAEDGVQTRGRVLAKEPTNHALIRYGYTVRGRTYAGEGTDGNGNPPFERIRVGDGVLVTYLPAEPQQSLLGSARTELGDRTQFVLGASLTLPTFAVWVNVWAYRRGKRLG